MDEQTEVASFKTPRSRKRLAKILAAKLDMADFSELMNYLLEQAINENLSVETQRELLGGETVAREASEPYETKPKKAKAGRHKAA